MNWSDAAKNKFLRQYGPWALVTGASSGIGLELSKRLAEAGFHLLLTARNPTTLNALEAQLKEQYPIQVRVVAVDLAESEGIQQLLQASESLDLGLLVASAGFGTSGLFINNTLADEVNMLRVNCEALLVLTHHFSQQMAQQKRGGIILMSSMVGFQGVPFAANYAATKAYVQSLAEGLREELRPVGVDVLAAAPGPVATSFGQRANLKMGFSLRPEDIGIPILKALGRKTTVLPGALTKLLVYSLRTVPRWAKIKIMKMVMGGMTQHQRP